MSAAHVQDGEVPAPLAAKMDAALARADAAAEGIMTAERLADVAFVALRAALEHGGARTAAFELLTADALLTAACAGLMDGTLPDALVPARFQALLRGDDDGSGSMTGAGR